MVEANGLALSVEAIVMAPMYVPEGNAVAETVSVAGVWPWSGLTASQPAGPELMLTTAVKGTGGVLAKVIVCVTGAPEGTALKAMAVVLVTKGLVCRLLVKVTSVKPAPNVAVMELVPVVPAGETTLFTT
jgi:hypothetical protein